MLLAWIVAVVVFIGVFVTTMPGVARVTVSVCSGAQAANQRRIAAINATKPGLKTNEHDHVS
ncbi:MAG: hypothetical protein IPL78_34165 [Chloroflexi bacterium]|nr:hypothetical protein [Chloroflexota bacterium]